MLPDTLAYQWSSLPVDGQLPVGLMMGSDYPYGLRLSPQEATTYYVVTDYPNEPSCPLTDTVTLRRVAVVESQLAVSSSLLWGDSPVLTALDLGDASWGREWYVNGLLQNEEGDRMTYQVGLGEDSLLVMLVNYNELCSDTAYATVGVIKQELWFPNVFTPDEATNNIFKGHGVNITQYDLQVYTKWGDRIFRTHQLDEGWDGTFNGVRSPVSAYVYRCDYRTLDGAMKTVIGTVTLLR